MPDQQSKQEPMQKKPSEPPKGPPCRTLVYGLFGSYETKKSIRAREDYDIYIKAYMEGLLAGRHK